MNGIKELVEGKNIETIDRAKILKDKIEGPHIGYYVGYHDTI
jgi:hypothetical protein